MFGVLIKTSHLATIATTSFFWIGFAKKAWAKKKYSTSTLLSKNYKSDEALEKISYKW